MANEFTLNIGKLLLGSMPRSSVLRITDSPDMTSAVYFGRKATNQINNQMKQLNKEEQEMLPNLNHINYEMSPNLNHIN